jgi:hypothetical protein
MATQLYQGETGVSKTALTRMYAILRNNIIEEEAKRTTSLHLEEIAQELVDSGHHVPLGFISPKRLEQALVEASESVIGNETDFAKALHELLLQKCHNRPSIFQGVPVEYAESGEARTTVVSSMLNWFCSNMLECTFFDVNVDSSLTERDFLESFVPIKAAAQKLRGSEAMVVIFLDGKLSFIWCHLYCWESAHAYLLFCYERIQYILRPRSLQGGDNRPHTCWATFGRKHCRHCCLQSCSPANHYCESKRTRLGA